MMFLVGVFADRRRWMWRRWRVFVRPTKVSFHASTVCPINASINEMVRRSTAPTRRRRHRRPASSRIIIIAATPHGDGSIFGFVPGARDMTKMLRFNSIFRIWRQKSIVVSAYYRYCYIHYDPGRLLAWTATTKPSQRDCAVGDVQQMPIATFPRCNAIPAVYHSQAME
jgi:hypothetical protein